MPTQGPALWGASGRDNDRGQSHWQRVSEEAGSQGTVRPSAWSANVHVYLSALQLQVKDTLPEGRLSFAGKEGLEEQPLPLDANVLDVVKGRSSDLFASTFQGEVSSISASCRFQILRHFLLSGSCGRDGSDCS